LFTPAFGIVIVWYRIQVLSKLMALNFVFSKIEKTYSSGFVWRKDGHKYGR
jgi:hypothetical protein